MPQPDLVCINDMPCAGIARWQQEVYEGCERTRPKAVLPRQVRLRLVLLRAALRGDVTQVPARLAVYNSV
jgi:hypothetical protein